jgi:hypothetical protein
MIASPDDTEYQPRTMKPLKSDIVNVDQDRDEAKNGWNLTALERMLSDCDQQPNYWRDQADLAAGYIDGKQFTPLQEQALRAEGMNDLRPTNLIGRIVRGILGQEAKSRTDVKIEADEDDESDVCDVLSLAMKEARREAKVDMGVSGAYAGQVGVGLGWCKVDRDPDPLNYPHRVRVIDRRKVWWDWAALDPLLRDARWLVHKEWADLDELEATMPQHRKVLQNAANGWMNFKFDNTDYELTQVNAFSDYKNFAKYRQRTEWFDTGRRRIKMYEVWYRVPAHAIVLQLGPTRRVLFNEQNQTHINAVMSGKVKITKTISSQVRCALYAGPHRLQDVGTARRVFPYVPFFAYRDDQDQTPYGLVEGMIGPQDEYNARRIRINWMLRARQIMMDNDALDEKANSLAQIADAIMRPDLTVVLNPNRKNQNAFTVGNSLEMQKEQIDMMQDAKQLIQDVPGVYGSQLGQAASGVTSGIANSLLIEQGAVAMGDLNDNYRDSRGLVHEILLDQLIEDHSAAQLQCRIGSGSSRRVVVLNDFDEQGNMVNSVADAALRVGLGEVPSTPSYRMMQQQQVATVIQALAQASPQAAAIMTPSFVEMTDLPDRQERADDIRRALNIPTASDKQNMAQMQEAAEAEKQKQAQAAQAMQTLTMEGLAAKIENTKSATELNNAKAVEIGHAMALAQGEPDPYKDPEAERKRLIDEAMAEAQGSPPVAQQRSEPAMAPATAAA